MLYYNYIWVVYYSYFIIFKTLYIYKLHLYYYLRALFIESVTALVENDRLWWTWIMVDVVT